jgi:hypothetical protein
MPSSKSRWITKSSWLSSGKRSAQTKQPIQNLGRHSCRDKNNTTTDTTDGYIGTPYCWRIRFERPHLNFLEIQYSPCSSQGF